jgi:hypothetical protein
MHRSFSGSVWVLTCALGLAPTPGCRYEADRAADRHQPLAVVTPKPDTGIALRIVLPRDTISADDPSAVEVVYYFINGPAKTMFDDNPEHYGFWVQRRDGRPAHVRPGGGSLLLSPSPEYMMVLPAGAWLGRVFDLRCFDPLAGYGARPYQDERDCNGGYLFDAPGEYIVMAGYTSHPYYGPATAESLLTGQLDSSRARLLAPQRILRDTAVLVVR